MASKMHGDGATLAPVVPVEVVFVTLDGDGWFPFMATKQACDAVRNGEEPAFVFMAALGLSERN